MTDRRQEMLDFWSERVKEWGSDPRANTNDVWLREVEIDCLERLLDAHGPSTVLDFGCANGYTTARLARRHPEIAFVGLDLNPDMIASARESATTAQIPNASFMTGDVLEGALQGESFDLIMTVRVFQNMESLDVQRRVFDRLCLLLNPGGLLFWLESYEDGYEQINSDREAVGLPPLPIHSHLTLLTQELEQHAASKLELLERSSPSSSYYLITRLAYSYLAQVEGADIDYDHPLHRIAARVPALGEYGPQRAMLFRLKE